MTQSGTTQTFTYNDEGIRTSKTVNGVTTTYYLSGSQIIAEETSGNLTVYIYDASGSPIGMQYHGASYAEDVWDVFWYEKNLQGDIVAVYDSSGMLLIEYNYSAYGRIKIVDYNADLYPAVYNNPFRYRGYYYDKDLDLYYLNARYYDRKTGRFISPDYPDVVTATPGALTDKNLYAYCDNNPVMRVDKDGDLWLETLGIMAVGGLIGASVSAVSSIVSQLIFNNQDVNWLSVAVAAGSGFVGGVIAASPLTKSYQAAFGGILGGITYVADKWINDEAVNLLGLCVSVFLGAFSGWLGGDGANVGQNLSRTIESTRATIAREGRRANEKYALKAMERAVNYSNSVISNSGWSTGAKFGLTNFGSNIFNGAIAIFDNTPSWKPW